MNEDQVEFLLDFGHLWYQLEQMEDAGDETAEVDLQLLLKIVNAAVVGMKHVANRT